MSLSRGDEIQLTIDDLALGGDGVGRYDGMAIFVTRALPGEVVRARVQQVKPAFAKATLVSVDTPAPGKIEPFCPHFHRCGGCSWQHLAYEDQLAVKQHQVVQALNRIGGIAEPHVTSTIASPRTTRYRNKMEFTFRGTRKDHLHLGLHRLGSPDTVFDVDECPLMDPLVGKIVAETRAFCRASGASVWQGRGREKGIFRHLVVRRSHATEEFLVHLITAPGRQAARIGSGLGEKLTTTFPGITSFVHSSRHSRTAFAQGERVLNVIGEKRLRETLGDLRFYISADAFFQTNTEAAELLYNAASDAAGLSGTEHVVDLYCGSGGLALWMARRAASVLGVEADAHAVADAKRTAVENAIENCRFLAADVLETLEAPMDPSPDVIIIDPPRTGMHKDAAPILAENGPARLVYVSCNPATLARDAKNLAPAYTLRQTTPVDLFPHTPHIESVSLFVRG
ncbi:23S rRNA (uracil(1939)-C(5))-methyltransferase RlmD [Desulfovibrio inopinatus]|uniref:23S rRNA (uracil(1939)-C(5))-methyltransferase RlmD n=1 Tax=Desulfovibrio inopinatus TaxID=102109 RepID=UPI0004293541|nr:23S rRNA (uracil(1939)-C(5))-methyltransferase RlmD [Desulfovibrio inopinatus]